MISPSLLTLISVIYGLLAVRTAWEVWRHHRSLFDHQITSEDSRLAQAIAFYLLWPPAVLLHEGGHAIVAALFGAQHIRLHFFGYWGEISYDPTLTARQDWWVALAGNVVTYGLGLACFAAARSQRRRPVWRLILFSVASNQWFVVLLWYPGLCLSGAFQGDFNVIYGHAWWWIGSIMTAGVNILSLTGYLWTNYTEAGRRWMRRVFWRASANR